MISFDENNYKTYYSWEKFRTLNPQERQQLLEYTVDQIRTEKGLQKISLHLEDRDPGSRGQWQPSRGWFNRFKGHEIHLNNDILRANHPYAAYSMYNTINHEIEHASQYEMSLEQSETHDNPEILEQQLNDQNYFSADAVRFGSDGKHDRDFQLYRAQASEAEARKAGLDAVKALRESNLSQGIEDKNADKYIRYAEAREIKKDREMIETLGMHSRESMAAEELSYISDKYISQSDRVKVLNYAREKDYQTSKSVLQRYEHMGEDQVKEEFSSNKRYDFFKSTTYDVAKRNGRDVTIGDRLQNESGKVSYADKREAFIKSVKRSEISTSSAESKRESFRAAMQKGSATSNISNASKRDSFRSVMGGNVSSAERSISPRKTVGTHNTVKGYSNGNAPQNSSGNHSTVSHNNGSSNKVKR